MRTAEAQMRTAQMRGFPVASVVGVAITSVKDSSMRRTPVAFHFVSISEHY